MTAGADAATIVTPRVTFRAAVASDALCIGVLGTQVFLDNYATDGIRPPVAREVLEQLSTAAVTALLGLSDTRCVLAERAGHLVGFAQLAIGVPHALVASPRPSKLNRLYVQERFTGIGLGTALLTRAEAIARVEGSTALWLATWIGNERALGFYPRRGYRDVGATPYVFEGEAHENRVFAKTLDGDADRPA